MGAKCSMPGEEMAWTLNWTLQDEEQETIWIPSGSVDITSCRTETEHQRDDIPAAFAQDCQHLNGDLAISDSCDTEHRVSSLQLDEGIVATPQGEEPVVQKVQGNGPSADTEIDKFEGWGAPEPERCATCLQALATFPLGVCVGCDGSRTCPHFFHYHCLRRVRPRRCPVCRAPFERIEGLPNIVEDPSGWGRRICFGRGETMPSKKDVLLALKATLLLPPDEVETLLESWPPWTNPSLRLSPDLLRALAKSVREHVPSQSPPPVEMHEQDSSGHNADGHRNSNQPGEICTCGRIHAHRGDRVRRGPAWMGSDEDGGTGQFGTIVRDEEACGTVIVQWDRAVLGDVRRYAWPADPGRHEVQHAAFEDIAVDVRQCQDLVGLSSAAASELLRRKRSCRGTGEFAAAPRGATSASGARQAASRSAISLNAQLASTLSEDDLREKPKLFHRCRILPDQAHVRQWFDACPPCPCSRPNCRGGVRWNAQAARHLGREGYLLKIDERDGTVLVELTGRCNCKIWYPYSAIQPVFDPDTANEPRFQVGTVVECNIDGGWHRGVVSCVWWRPASGWGNRPTAPYAVNLRDGRSVFASRDSDHLIKAAPNSEL